MDKFYSQAASILRMPVTDTKVYFREEEGFIYFWKPDKSGLAVIFDKNDGSFLSTNRMVPYADHVKLFKDGYRSEALKK